MDILGSQSSSYESCSLATFYVASPQQNSQSWAAYIWRRLPFTVPAVIILQYGKGTKKHNQDRRSCSILNDF